MGNEVKLFVVVHYMADMMMMMMGMGFLGFMSVTSSLVTLMYKDTLCQSYPALSFLCPVTPTTAPAIAETSAPTTAPATTAATTGGSNTGSLRKRFSPYLLLNNSSLGLIGTKSRWTTLAFVVGYANNKIQWDAGAVDMTNLKAKITAANKNGGGVIVSFGGQGAGAKGTRFLSELAGKYADPVKLADAYGAIATALQSTWLDFDVEGAALKDSAAIDRRNKAIALLQKKRTDIRISFTVPTGLSGLDAPTKAMLSKAKNAGVKIDLVNIMAMYFINSKTVMSTATTKATAASKPFIKSLGAKVGVTSQIGVNPENFTTSDASKVVTALKSDGDVALLSFWSLNNDVAKHKGAFTKAFKAYN